MTETGVPDEKRMRLRYAGTCRICSCELPKGADAVYEKGAKSVRCITCSKPIADEALDEMATSTEASTVVDPGVPGASARREFERRQARREERIRFKHKRLGGLMLAVSDDPQSTRAWATGATGEERLGARLNELAGEELRVLHDRRIPATRANIDHLAVTANGVFVIDAKRYKGRPSLVVEGGLVRPRVEKLMVGGRDRSKLIDGVLKQVEVVRGITEDHVAVVGVLCFIEADWPLIGGSFRTRGVDVVRPKKLYPRLEASGPLSLESVDQLHRALAAALPSANWA